MLFTMIARLFPACKRNGTYHAYAHTKKVCSICSKRRIGRLGQTTLLRGCFVRVRLVRRCYGHSCMAVWNNWHHNIGVYSWR